MIKKKWDMFAESVSMSLSNIAGNKMRTFLTTLGIIIGVGAIIALMPVVQGATNMDYGNRDVYGDFSLSGAIFLDSRCAADLTDPYTVIYGHHMDNSAMFGDVARFAEADYFAAHPAGSISLPDAAYTIELFACVVTDAYDTAIYTPERYHDDVGALLDYAAAQAVQQRDIGVTAQDRLVALSTCAGSETNGRVVVLGRLCPLKEGDEMQ